MGNYYLKYGDKIKGEVKDPAAYRGWIELEGVQWGTNRPPTGHGSFSDSEASSKLSEIVVTKKVDSTSTLLASEAIAGKAVTAVVDFVKAGAAFLRITMSETMISGYSVSGGGYDARESLTLNFTKIEFKNNPGPPPP